jgi:regulator of protease activity HflC (stomatin/prohibitin superfamily)
VFALTPFEEASKIYDSLSLNFSQYVMIQHSITGVIRIEKGPAKVLLVPFEEFIRDIDANIIRNALTADANNAIHIRDIVTGKEELITENQLYFPDSPNIHIIGRKPLIKLASYERMVIMDRESNLIFKTGETSPGFFLPPFCKILTQNWSLGKEGQKKEISVFDCRFNDMDFNFSVRTNDNVEILMSVNIYWKITNFEKLFKSTSDPPQDICNQVRSQILNVASKMTTKDLMEYSSLEMVQQILNLDPEFWICRGMHIVRVNLTEKKCSDPEVDKTYRQVIEQKILRVRNLEAQRGQNDKKIAEIEGNILLETENYKLLEKKMANMQMENETKGRADGERIHMFFTGLGEDLAAEEKMKVFLELQRTERIKMVTAKVNNLYVTPADVDFQLQQVEKSDS